MAFGRLGFQGLGFSTPSAGEYTPPPPTLAALTLSNYDIAENAAAGAVVGAIQGKAGGSTLELTDDAGGRFAIAGGNLVRGATALDYEAGAEIAVEITETLAGATNSPHVTGLIVDVTNVLEVALAALTGDFSLAENAAAGAVAGAIGGKSSGSSLELIDDAGGRVALSGTNIVRGATGLNFEAGDSYAFTVRETHADASNSPRDTVLNLAVTNVFEQPDLGALTLSATTFVIGTPSDGTINGATSGSTIEASGLPTGLTIDGAARTWAWDGTGAADAASITLTETLADSENSPRDSVIGVTIEEAATALAYGRVAGYDAGTTANLYVAADGSDTTGDGSLASPYATLQKAHDMATAGQAIAVRAGTYFETLAQTKALTIKGYGTELPVISGGYNVAGWAVCTSSDEAVVGANYASIYKATINKSVLDAGLAYYNALLLTEDDTVLDLAQRRADESNLWEQTRAGTAFTTADGVSFATSGGYITTITHAAVLGDYSDAQLAAAYVYIHGSANSPVVEKVASASGGVLTLPAGSNIAPQSGTQTYALLNILPAMVEGQWGFVDNGATIDLYVWPIDTGNLASGITIAARTNVLSVAATAAGSVYRNLRFEHCADSIDSTAAMIQLASGTDAIDMQQCEMRRYSHRNRGAGCLLALNADDLIFRRNTVQRGQNQYGIFLNGTSGGGWGTGARVEYNRFESLTQSSCRRYGQRFSAYRFNFHENVGSGDHANKLNASLSGDVTLDQGNVWQPNCGGYVTVQTTSRMLLLNNIVPTSADGRAFEDQNYDGSPTPTDPSNNYLIGNLMPLAPGATVVGLNTAIMADKSPGATVDPNWGIYNNVCHGITVGAGQLLGRENNVLTLGAAVGSGEEVAELVDIYYDAGTGAWTTVPGSVLLTKDGRSVESIIAEWEGYYPDLDIRLDALGNAWNPAEPGVGPYAQGAWPIEDDATAPVLSGLAAEITGTTAACSVTTDEPGTIYWVALADGAATPTNTQIAAGQDASAGAAPGSGDVFADAPGEQAFNVAGSAGVVSKLAVTQADRNGNLADPVILDLEFPADFTPQWVAFNGANYLKRGSPGADGAQATTQEYLIAITHKRSSGQNGVSTAGIMDTLPSTRAMSIDYTTNHRLQARFERAAADNVTVFNQLPPTQATGADVEFLTLIQGWNDGSNFRQRIRVINLATGEVFNETAAGTSDAANYLTWAATNTFNIFKAAGTYERFILWDDVTADISDQAVLDLFYDTSAHALKDPAVAAVAIGTPLISFYGAGLTSGANAGSGGNWTFS